MNKTLKTNLRRFLPRSIRSHWILAGPLRGLRIITSWHDYPSAILGRTERSLLVWFEKNAHFGETWLDVGAHYGYTALALSRQVGPAGRVFAFEPMLETAGYLAQTRRLNQFSQLTVLPFALAAPTVLETLQLPSVRGMLDSTLALNDTNAVDTLMVARLDWLWPQVCSDQPQIDGIKIDVQGMEIETLRGMAELLKAYHPKLVVEVHAGVDRAELLALLESLGYSRRAVPIELAKGETEPRFLDDRSYAFYSEQR